MTELRPTLCVDACKQGLLTCLLKRLKVGTWRKRNYSRNLCSSLSKVKSPFSSIRLYCSELMSILLQNHDENRQMLGELEGIDILLQQLAVSFLISVHLEMNVHGLFFSTTNGMILKQVKNSNTWRICSVVYVHH